MWAALGLFSLVTLTVLGQSVDVSVTIPQGTVVGVSYGNSYIEFYGIPYADSTSGINRFKAPSAPPSFQDTFVANRKNIKCVRPLGTGFEGTEDCLVANVFTSTIDTNAQLPVMVWVKGKEFDKYNDEEPSFTSFVEKGVVVVSLNYRESILGYLCLGTETAPGNAGLKDIVAGLRWVQQNIANFGGNPNDVTLVGHGSGAAAVDLVTLSPLANGLVQKAITQSGTALAPWAVTRDNLKYAREVAEALGHQVSNVQELSDIFTRTSVAALMAVINELDLTDNSLAFAPCIEKSDLTGVEPFMVRTPYEILTNNDYVRIPFLTGYVDNEGTIRSEEAVQKNWIERMDESFTEFLQPDLKFENEADELQVANQIRSYYFGQSAINANRADDFITYQGDTLIMVSTLREMRLRSASTVPVYLYQFSYKGSLGEPFVGPLAVNSAAHSEELAYMLYAHTSTTVDDRDLIIGEILTERWTNFAKTGDPQSETSSIYWRPYTSINSIFLRILDNDEINEESSFEVLLQNPHAFTQTFWDHIYSTKFLDAESDWEWSERNDEEGSGEEENTGEGGNENGTGEEENEEGGEEAVDEDEDEDSEDSASTAIAYTFTIISLFTILNHFHFSQIMS